MTQSIPTAADANQPRRELSLVDSTSIIVGIIIGSGIYQSSPDIAAGSARWGIWLAGNWGAGLAGYESAIGTAAIIGVWLFGGLIALVGAMCYAELGTAFPKAGGTYVFLSEAFGRNVGFAFAWAEFWIVRPGNVGAISFIMARYARQIVAPEMSEAHRIELSLAARHDRGYFGALMRLGFRPANGHRTYSRPARLLGLAAVVVAAFTLPPARVHLSFARRGLANAFDGADLRNVRLWRLGRYVLRGGRSPQSGAKHFAGADAGERWPSQAPT